MTYNLKKILQIEFLNLILILNGIIGTIAKYTHIFKKQKQVLFEKIVLLLKMREFGPSRKNTKEQRNSLNYFESNTIRNLCKKRKRKEISILLFMNTTMSGSYLVKFQEYLSSKLNLNVNLFLSMKQEKLSDFQELSLLSVFREMHAINCELPSNCDIFILRNNYCVGHYDNTMFKIETKNIELKVDKKDDSVLFVTLFQKYLQNKMLTGVSSYQILNSQLHMAHNSYFKKQVISYYAQIVQKDILEISCDVFIKQALKEIRTNYHSSFRATTLNNNNITTIYSKPFFMLSDKLMSEFHNSFNLWVVQACKKGFTAVFSYCNYNNKLYWHFILSLFDSALYKTSLFPIIKPKSLYKELKYLDKLNRLYVKFLYATKVNVYLHLNKVKEFAFVKELSPCYIFMYFLFLLNKETLSQLQKNTTEYNLYFNLLQQRIALFITLYNITKKDLIYIDSLLFEEEHLTFIHFFNGLKDCNNEIININVNREIEETSVYTANNVLDYRINTFLSEFVLFLKNRFGSK